MTTLTLGSGFGPFLSTFEPNISKDPREFLTGDDPVLGPLFDTFQHDFGNAATVQKNTGAEGILSGSGYFVVIDGIGLSLSPGSGAATFDNYFSNSSGTMSSIKVYYGGSVSGGTFSGGTLVATAALNPSEESVAVGSGEIVVDGANLPTTFAAWEALTNLTYTGPSISLSDIRYLHNSVQIAQATLPADPLTTALNDYQVLASVAKDIRASPFTPLQLSATQLVFQNADGFVTIQGVGLSYTGSLSSPIDLQKIAGT